MAEEQKKSSGAGKFFLGAALGAIAGAIAGKFISSKDDEEDETESCCCDEDCPCKEEKVETPAKKPAKNTTKKAEK